MAIETKIQGGSSTAGQANVDTNYNVQVNLPYGTQGGGTNAAGFVTLLSELDAGSVTGERYHKELEATEDFRLRVGEDTILFNHSFEGTNIARDRIQQNDTTATAAQTNGQLTLNSGGSVTSGQGTNIRTYRTFPVYMSAQTWLEMEIAEGNPTATNVISEYGYGFCSGVTAQLTDGAIFRRVSGGQLQAVIVNNSTDVVAQALTTTNVPGRDEVGTYDSTETNHYMIAIHNDEVQWWINDVLVYKAYASSQFGTPTSTTSLPFMARVYNSGTASAARTLAIRFLGVLQGEINTNKPWGHQLSGMGGGAYQIQPGTASGPTVTRGASTTAGWPNSAQARGAGTWTASTAPAINSLGGQWVSPAISTLTSEADYPVFSYSNPAGTATLPGKTLYITGVKWGKTVATAAAATNSISINYILGVGGTTSAVNQTEAAAVVAARGIVLDTIPFKATAVIGDYVEGGAMDFASAPLVVYPGCFISFVVRPYGTVTSNTLVVNGTVAFVGYFE